MIYSEYVFNMIYLKYTFDMNILSMHFIWYILSMHLTWYILSKHLRWFILSLHLIWYILSMHWIWFILSMHLNYDDLSYISNVIIWYKKSSWRQVWFLNRCNLRRQTNHQRLTMPLSPAGRLIKCLQKILLLNKINDKRSFQQDSWYNFLSNSPDRCPELSRAIQSVK